MTHYLFVESNTTGSGAIALRMLRARGDDVTFVTRARARYSFLRDAPDGARVIDAETNDLETLAACAQELSAAHPIDAVVTFSTFYVATVAALAARLGLRFLNEHAAATCHDKIAARRALQAAGLPNPAFWEIDSDASAARVAAEVTYPCVVKPPADSGSSGVLQIEDQSQFFEHYRRLASATTNDRGQKGSSVVLVEALLDGPEVSVESMTSDGATHILGITRKHLSAPPHFVELGHDFPATLSRADRLAIEEGVLRGLHAVGYDFGPAHTEVRLTTRGPVIVEINPRLAGGMIPELVRLATGIDLIDVYLRALAGETPALAATQERAASIRFLVAPHAGVLEALPHYDDLLDVSGVDCIQLTAKPGSVSLPSSAYDRLGFLILSGDPKSNVSERADEVVKICTERLRAAIR
jgi:S-sulfo-L-cysteine synthase (3-phospho-L-serine-dependent)